jgi:hypothetical protein
MLIKRKLVTIAVGDQCQGSYTCDCATLTRQQRKAFKPFSPRDAVLYWKYFTYEELKN